LIKIDTSKKRIYSPPQGKLIKMTLDFAGLVVGEKVNKKIENVAFRKFISSCLELIIKHQPI